MTTFDFSASFDNTVSSSASLLLRERFFLFLLFGGLLIVLVGTRHLEGKILVVLVLVVFPALARG